jgi:transposase
MLVSAVRASRRADRVRHPFKGGFVNIDARGETPTRRRALQHQNSHVSSRGSRGQVEAQLANMPPCLIGMEACVGAHHLSCKLQSLGHDAR